MLVLILHVVVKKDKDGKCVNVKRLLQSIVSFVQLCHVLSACILHVTVSIVQDILPFSSVTILICGVWSTFSFIAYCDVFLCVCLYSTKLHYRCFNETA